MVVNILKAHKSMKGTLQYNQTKVNRGAARVLGSFNMEGGATFHDFRRTFESYEKRRIRTEKVSFQMSINPSPDRPGEKLTDAEAVAYARNLLDGLGYGDQPTLVYEHRDIKRTHYHVVSIRVNAEGRKIKDSFEEKELQRLMHRYAKQYHYTIGNEDGKKKSRRRPSVSDSVPRFAPEGGDVLQQYRDLFDEALTYRFSTFPQFQTIMQSMGVDLDLTEGEGYHLLFQGLDAAGRKASRPIGEADTQTAYYRLYEQRLQQLKREKDPSPEEKKRRGADAFRVGKTVAFCLENARTEKHFARMLERKGIAVRLSRSADGSLFGATFVDRTSKTAFKASELKKYVSSEALKAAAAPETGTWATGERELLEQWKEQKREERLEAHIQHNMDLAAAQGAAASSFPTGEPTGPEVGHDLALLARQALDDILAGLNIGPNPYRKRSGKPAGKRVRQRADGKKKHTRK